MVLFTPYHCAIQRNYCSRFELLQSLYILISCAADNPFSNRIVNSFSASSYFCLWFELVSQQSRTQIMNFHCKQSICTRHYFSFYWINPQWVFVFFNTFKQIFKISLQKWKEYFTQSRNQKRILWNWLPCQNLHILALEFCYPYLYSQSSIWGYMLSSIVRLEKNR